MNVGDRIKQRRMELHMTQQELAERLGYRDKSSIAKIEAGVNSLTMPMVEKFADTLDCTGPYLMGWTEEDDTPKGINIEVTDNELVLLQNFRNADDVTRQIVEKILNK